MELRHLRYFVAVAEELSYRKASERLRVAQPALSSQIKDLENEIGVTLLDRDTGGVRLNDAGAAFLVEARLILAQAQHALLVGREAAIGRRGHLSIAYFAPLLMGFIPACLKAFHEAFPAVEVTLRDMLLGEQIAALRSGAIQIGFAIKGSMAIPPDLQHVEVARSPIRAVVSREHRLAGKRRIALADLVHESLLCLSPKKGGGSVHGEIMRQGFAARGLKPGSIRSVEGAESFLATLESGMGVSLIAEIGSLSRSPDLVFKPLVESGADLYLELHAMWRDGQTSQITANFVALMKKMAVRKKLSGKRRGPKRRSPPKSK